MSCVCGHGPYNHGGGHTLIGRIIGEHSRCIRCDCMEYRRVCESTAGGGFYRCERPAGHDDVHKQWEVDPVDETSYGYAEWREGDEVPFSFLVPNAETEPNNPQQPPNPNQ